MEQSYWLARKRSSAANARRAASSEARLVHLDLAGRYSVKAAAAARSPWTASEAVRPAPADAAYYERLETGARWLASRAPDGSEREAHLGHANHYARLRLAAAAGSR
jgi:hypothetical protein